LPLEDFPVEIASVTYAQAKSIFLKSKDQGRKRFSSLLSEDLKGISIEELATIVYDSFLTLEELLQVFFRFSKKYLDVTQLDWNLYRFEIPIVL
jgi:hypothetical protein